MMTGIEPIDWSKVERLEAELMPESIDPLAGSSEPLTYETFQALLQKVHDEAPDYFELSRRIGETREGAKTRLMAERYDTNNPLHYIQRYGSRHIMRIPPSMTITGRTLSKAEARAAVELGMRRAEALLTGYAGDSVSE